MLDQCTLALSLLPDLLRGPSAQFESLGQWVFFKIVFEFLDNEVLAFRETMVHGMASWIGGLASSLMALWIFMQGYKVMTGQSRNSMMELAVGSMRNVLIVMVATSLTVGTSSLYTTLSDDLPRAIAESVTGRDQDPAQTIDRGLTNMQLAMAAIEALPALDNPGIKDDKDRALMLTGIGVAGPAVVGGALLVMYKFALALFVGLGPLFILALMFDQTKSMFARWLQYGIGTMFSLAVLSFTVTVAMKMVGAVAANFAAQYMTMMALGAGDSPGVNTMALQQGGLGIFLTVLILSVPPMASSFFQGVLGNFMHYSAFGANSAPGRPETPANGGYRPETSAGSAEQTRANQNQHTNQSAQNTSLGSGKLMSSHNDTHAKDRMKDIGPQKDEIRKHDNPR
ncbi:type IV secretion system protein [Lysobacter enzymogenes]|uniref:Type IV secretion system protein n=1 Tax=Lysobacter enzymogenes TaxID=69 RepID=A0A3N2RD23_LYSEN|nr:type IV secretion system protein [Lysobacter enzymogenes]ROU05335.1 type IV secretion system protein [Lysobacter enzymogenes]